ncbi:hypothetical protein ACU639_35490 [Streptomyces cynarae]|uniref:hypothetical protein n=1 Tax=Streptomyces cynarae TaxID=2981134 RepID=UPI00406C4AFF
MASVVDHDLAGAHLAAADRMNAVNNVRTTLLQAIGGAVVLFGAYATWRQLRVSQDGLNPTRERQVTDRFSRAVEQLGNDKLRSPSARTCPISSFRRSWTLSSGRTSTGLSVPAGSVAVHE